MTDIMTETPEDKAALEAIQNETEFQLADDPQPEVRADPDPAPKDEPKAEPKAEPEPKKPVRLVPHEALHEERTRRQALERRIAELEKPKEQPRAAPVGDEEPDEHADPLAAIAWLKAKIAKSETDRQAFSQEQQRVTDLGQRVKARVDAYAAEHPEYTDQLTHLRQSRFNELRLLGLDDQSAIGQVMQEEMSIGQMAIDKDLDPGEIISNLSKHRGWKAKEAPKEDPKPKEAEQKIERLQRGQKAAISPSVGGGEGAQPEMTLEHLVSLQGDAFDKAVAKHGRRLLGG